MWTEEDSESLSHLRVVDFSVLLPGALVTRTLAQYGAQVVKVENLPHGDPLRQAPNPSYFELFNQSKRSLAVDLRKSEIRDAVLRLIAESDIFVEGFREGVLDAMGFGYADVARLQPDLIYLSIRGFSGSAASLPGHDLNFIASSGVGEWFLEGPNTGTQFGDIVGGYYIPLIRLLAQVARPTQRGLHIQVAIDEGMRSLYLPRAFEAAAKNKGGVSTQHLLSQMPHSGYFRCKEQGWIALNAVQPKHWKAFCEAAGHPDWYERGLDPTLKPEVQNLFSEKTAVEWEKLALAHSLCLTRVVSWAEHTQNPELFLKLQQDPLTWAGFPAARQLRPAPLLGADTLGILTSLGVSTKDFAEWVGNGWAVQAGAGRAS